MILRIYSEHQEEQTSIALFIRRISEDDSGVYKCTAVYASNHNIESSVEVFAYSEYNPL